MKPTPEEIDQIAIECGFNTYVRAALTNELRAFFLRGIEMGEVQGYNDGYNSGRSDATTQENKS